MAILYAQTIQFIEVRTRKELESVQNVLHSQYQQYQQTKESIEMINQKYHDFRHQIGILRIMDSDEKREAYLNEIENDIKMHEVKNKTGNEVLDTILEGKSLRCFRSDIKLTCVADGSLLDFMKTIDICSLLGNALENAIECEEGIKDKRKRLIHFSVSAQKKFILIKVENYFDGELKIDAGILKTNKRDKGNHGYGIKSMKHVAQKYNGTLTTSVSKQWFELKVLIPRP